MPLTHTLPQGVTPLTRGTVAVAGPALRWLRRLDEFIVREARSWGAEEHEFPSVIAAADLERIDYFRSFPHLMTVPVSLPEDDAATQRFTERCGSAEGIVPLAEHAPIAHALLPAACYQVYPALRSGRLEGPSLVTTRATCFRRESHFVPLRRQWAFTMREVVCVGNGAEVTELLERGTALVEALCEHLRLSQSWAAATDPFFQPARQGRYLYQRLNPVKYEAVVDDLAVASANRHHEHFGDAFAISRAGQPAQSACVAFGLERWLSVVAARWGTDPARWPDPMSAGGDHA